MITSWFRKFNAHDTCVLERWFGFLIEIDLVKIDTDKCGSVILPK